MYRRKKYERKKNLKVLIIVVLVIVLIFIGYFVYNRVIFKKNKIFKNVKDEKNLNLVVKIYDPYEHIMLESDNQEMINEIINAFDSVKVRRNPELIIGGSDIFVISNENFKITFGLRKDLLNMNGKQYDIKMDSGDITDVIDNILKKYGKSILPE